MSEVEVIKKQIFKLVEQYYLLEHTNAPFSPEKSSVPVSGRVYDAQDLIYLVDSALEFWLTTGRFADRFEREFAKFMGIRHAILTNSGSSANLLALSALTSESLGDRRLKPGDEVITVAAGFPTTVNPIIQNNMVPVFVDIDLETHNIDVSQLEVALSDRTRAVMIAHTLGNPFDLGGVVDFVEQNNLWLIEDTCDAVGSTYEGQLVGTFGDLATVSFYPAHHMTMGEGGCVLTKSPSLKKLVESFRDWGRDCWCAPGVANTCGKRFEWQLGELPYGYDHKYIYSHIGYNLKLTDMQAAVGVAQLQKLPEFIEKRKQNWRMLYQTLKPFEKHLLLPEPTANSDPSWFGFLLTVKPDASFSRNELIQHLESNRIATRLLFGGNLMRQPAYQNASYRTIGSLPNTDFAMENSFWIGVYPGISTDAIEYVGTVFNQFFTDRMS